MKAEQTEGFLHPSIPTAGGPEAGIHPDRVTILGLTHASLAPLYGLRAT